MTIRLALASTLALALAACGSNDTGDDTVAEVAPTETPGPTALPTPDTSSPQAFVDAMSASDKYEIEAAKLAQAQSKSDKVKAFAAMMIKDHTTSSDKLEAAIAEAGTGLMIAATLPPVLQGHLDQLRNAGESFDAMYAQQQVDAHETALAELQSQAASGSVASLKTFAADTATVVEGHLAEARKLP